MAEVLREKRMITAILWFPAKTQEMGFEGGIRIYDAAEVYRLDLWKYLNWFAEVREGRIWGTGVVYAYYGDNLYPYSGWKGGRHTYGCVNGEQTSCSCDLNAPFTEEEAMEALAPAFLADWRVW